MAHPALAAAAAAKPFIDWAALLKVAGVSFAFGVLIVVVFSVGVLGWSRAQPRLSSPADGTPRLSSLADGTPRLVPVEGDGAAPAVGSRPLGVGLAVVCFAVCAGATCYGLWLIIPQFHR
jgi:hypothetical protein